MVPVGEPPPDRQQRSTVRQLRDGRTREFPNRQDLVQTLIAAGEVESEADLLDNHPDKISELLFAWIAHGQTACLFAARLARRVDEAGWVSVVVRGAPCREMIADLNTALEASPTHSHAVQFVFPDIERPADIAQLVLELSGHERWLVKRIPDSPAGTISIGLRWQLPGGGFRSWVLGFAPLETMPFTRQAPFTAIVMRVREPEPGSENTSRPQDDDGVPSVHLADMPALVDDELFQRLWAETERQKRLMLTDDEAKAARAKVTFALPLELEDLLSPALG